MNPRPASPAVRLTALSFGVMVLLGSAPDAAGADKPRVQYNRDIRPILSNNCFQCHGPDPSNREAGLRLDVGESATGETDSGEQAIVPGEPAASELLRRISSDDPDERMPPEHSNKPPLAKEQVGLIRQWIVEGAEYQKHWSLISPKRPGLPAVKERDWPRNAIDYFILARLETEGLAPSEAAARRSLIRRVTLDLTGLPPSIDEVEAFAVESSPDAYEKVVDRLLRSERYGEHMARFWLDAARYGDTHGLHLDNYREIWPYRDWVIRAFNFNMRWDDFTVKQLAGDLLPEPTHDDLVATGFNRCHVTTNEGGSIAEEVFVRNVVDRVSTTGTVYLGLTVGCAVCHDHKFDPITNKDFYSMYAFFNNLDGNPMDGNRKDHAPIVPVPNAEQEQKLAKLEQQLATARQRIADELTSVEYSDPGADAGVMARAAQTVWIDDAIPRGARESEPWQWVDAPEHPVYSGTAASTRTVEGLGQHYFTEASPPLAVASDDTLFAYVYLDPDNPPKQIMLQWNDGGWEHRAYWGDDHIEWGEDGTASRRRVGPLPAPGKWARLEVTAADVGLSDKKPISGWAFTQFDGTVSWDHAGVISQPRVEFRSLAAWIAQMKRTEGKGLPKEVAEAVKADESKRSEDQTKRLREQFIKHEHPVLRERFRPLSAEHKKAEEAVGKLRASIPTTLVWKERSEARPAYILKRGQYDQPDKESGVLAPAVPVAMAPLPDGAPNNRLGLAQWLVDPAHPLMARVTVNRFWQQVFGRGLVETTGDFGSQGAWPSHPELLDWLALEFVESGWDVKRLMKTMLMSATYRQTSRLTPKLVEHDPENRLLARGPRYRLDAEMLRDQALAMSNLLIERIGGPSVKPPQPDGLWKAVGYSGSNTVKFVSDAGPDKVHRRSLYTFWKRTAPPPQMSTFDAPSREECTVRRERTNTPLQALLLLNDPQYVEAARNLAARVMDEGGSTAESRAALMFRLATLRFAEEQELAELVAVLEDRLAHYREHEEDAQQLIAVGESTVDASLPPAELAAWTLVANVVLNLDEVVTKQ